MFRILFFAFGFLLNIYVSQENSEDETVWQDWKQANGKHYESNELETQRKLSFLSNKRRIHEHNVGFIDGLSNYSMSTNHLSDLTDEEVLLNLHGFKDFQDDLRSTFQFSDRFFAPAGFEGAKVIDWRNKGAVTKVKNQGHCASCWAFSAIGALEGQYFMRTNQLVSLSEKELIYCSESNRGCHGGLPQRAFHDIQMMGGLGFSSTNSAKQECQSTRKKAILTTMGVVKVNNTEQDLKAAVALIGPISVGISLSHDLRHYHSGIFDGCQKKDRIRHSVLLVGYGTENGQDYWLVKNSWGAKWGEDGYIKIARNNGNMCHIAGQAVYPKIQIKNL